MAAGATAIEMPAQSSALSEQEEPGQQGQPVQQEMGAGDHKGQQDCQTGDMRHQENGQCGPELEIEMVHLKSTSGRLLNTSSLDGLRAIAVFHIIFGHHSMYTNWNDRHYEGFDLMGGVSMGLFYIISGFVMMLGYGKADGPPSNCHLCSCCCMCCDTCCGRCCIEDVSKSEGTSRTQLDTRKFLWKRFARLGPLWYLGNCLALPLFFTNYWSGGPERFWAGLVAALPPFGLNAWLQISCPAGHLWTISTMTFFYLCFPNLYYRVRRIKPENLRMIALLLYVIQVGQMKGLSILVEMLTGDHMLGYWFARSWPVNRLPCFIMGLCAARQCEVEAITPTLCQNISCGGSCSISKRCKLILSSVIYVGTIISGIAMGLIDDWHGFQVRFWGEILLPVVFYEIVTALAYPDESGSPSAVHKFLASRVMRFFADISLSVYVIHETLIRTLVLFLRGPVELDDEGYPEEHDFRMPPWGFPAIFVLSVLMGWFLTNFFEKPMSDLILKYALGTSANAKNRNRG
eukprot:gnl/TRDRNA2_/TRDRNA2_193368_c0_seq1.p1 gnl/TRDRNA2_/TRDRNA2_193368_c0~~gnl/TRDRNA2_/TRDRNA2_193368_c0_seq1.p1  ORF type:complete len:517 (-),score=40.35 gnl/TRDRNA2_/TRDRNA2_193368_c0_seq1:26-1576(-)